MWASPSSKIISVSRGRRPGRQRTLTFDNLLHGEYKTHTHDREPENNASHSGYRFPASGAHLEETQRWENISQGASTCRSNQFKNGPQIACDQADAHGTDYERAAEDQVPVRLVWLLWKPVVVHYFSANEAFQRQSSKHVESKAQSSNLNHHMTLGGEIVQHVSFRFVAKREEPC